MLALDITIEDKNEIRSRRWIRNTGSKHFFTISSGVVLRVWSDTDGDIGYQISKKL